MGSEKEDQASDSGEDFGPMPKRAMPESDSDEDFGPQPKSVPQEDSDDDFGPMPKPSEDNQEGSDDDDSAFRPPVTKQDKKKKKRRVEVDDTLYLENIPQSRQFERSYMHTDNVVKVTGSTDTNYIISGSVDGRVKIWRKTFVDIEFLKDFKAHTDALKDLCISLDGVYGASVGLDKTLKVYDILSLDLSIAIFLPFTPTHCTFVSPRGAPDYILAVASSTGEIHLYDVLSGASESIRKFTRHQAEITAITYNETLDVIASTDKKGAIEIWKMETGGFVRRENGFDFDMKMQTDFFVLQKEKVWAHDLSISPDGHFLVVACSDHVLRIFRFLSGKLSKVYDETLETTLALQSDPLAKKMHLERFDLGRRVAKERAYHARGQGWGNIQFDETGTFLFIPSLVGVKVINIHTNQLKCVIGVDESNERFDSIFLFQGKQMKLKKKMIIMGEEGDDDKPRADPTLFATSLQKSRFYLFTKREPEDVDARNILNEKPTISDIAANTLNAVTTASSKKANKAVIHTTMGDITIRLFAQEVPKTVENFTTHSNNGYYNGCIFHRVIKDFMIQTGDPTGNGTGGESIWGGEFEDEFHRSLKHDRPFTVSMANAGRNTNGSQFFITQVPCPHLDNKHTVFGRVVDGMDVVAAINKTPTNKEDKPYSEIKIISIKTSVV